MRHSILERGVQMNKLLIGSVALAAIGLGAPALAADMRAAPIAAAPAVYTWTGCYVGLQVGNSWGRSEHDTVANSGSTNAAGVFTPIPAGLQIAGPFSLTGFIGGAEAGCNLQVGWWVFGIEGDWSVTNKDGQAFEPDGGTLIRPGNPFWVSSTKERWLGTLRGRLGFTVWDKSLIFVSGGGAWAKIDASEFLVNNNVGAAFGTTFTPGAAQAFQQGHWQGGWTIGGGWEYALGYGWSIKSEYLYVDLGRYTTFNSILPGNILTANIIGPREIRLTDHIWRVGMNYAFR
jgi:outer membrane immunogenic protein